MACFLVPAGEAVVVEIAKKAAESKKESVKKESEATGHVPFTRKLGWLTKMLTGGAVLLAYEHIWHGEVVPFPPFLTAMNSADDTAEMLHEMSTVGVTMAIIVTTVWIGMVIASSVLEKRGLEDTKGELA